LNLREFAQQGGVHQCLGTVDMPGGLEKRRCDGVCACAPPLEAAPAAAMVIAAAMTLRREAGVAEWNLV
jgi:hypothetical protein